MTGQLAKQSTTPISQSLELDILIENASFGSGIIDENGHIMISNLCFSKLLSDKKKEHERSDNLIDIVKFNFGGVAINSLLSGSESCVVHIKHDESEHRYILYIDTPYNGLRLFSILPTREQNDNDNSLAYVESDPLTGLGNRHLFDRVLDNWQPNNESDSLTLFMIDLDRFKHVNDSLGHDVGDKLLELVAKRLKSATRDDDVLIRLGGDEFVILQTRSQSLTNAESIGYRVVELMRRPFLVNKHQVNIGACVGIAAINEGTENKSQLYKHADLALYSAKSAGTCSVRLFEPALEQSAIARRELEIDLRRALTLKEFVLHYQPEVSMQDKKINGFEALLRWENASRGTIQPDDFIPLAEEIGTIHSIGEWVLKKACKDVMKWPGELTIAVNVSPIQFEKENFVNVVCDALNESGLPAHRLEIEITENVLFSESAQAIDHLWQLNDLGVKIAVDDFGTGYSSLSLLNSFPFSKVKIDKSFIHEMGQRNVKALISSVLSVGDSMGIKTVAEGIETDEQYQALMKSGCVEGQGFLISRPVTADDVNIMLTEEISETTETG